MKSERIGNPCYPSTCSQETACPLCTSAEVRRHFHDGRREYLGCGACGFVFVPSRDFLSREHEKKRYDLHRNSFDDPEYRRYLNRLFCSVRDRLAPGSSGLDFGSGPEPVLARMFEDAGHSMTLYDRYYEPEASALLQRYDFITASEVVEHLRDPWFELDRLWNQIKLGGLLGIMTQSLAEQDAFSTWHYKNDPTHVGFFSRKAFAWLARRWHAELTFPEKDVFLFEKTAFMTGDPI